MVLAKSLSVSIDAHAQGGSARERSLVFPWPKGPRTNNLVAAAQIKPTDTRLQEPSQQLLIPNLGMDESGANGLG